MSDVEEEDAGSIPSRAMRFLGVVLGPGVSIRITMGKSPSEEVLESLLIHCFRRIAGLQAVAASSCSEMLIPIFPT